MKKTSIFFATILLSGAGALTGCTEYLGRHEGVTSFAGESLAANEAISVVDTWPDGFDDTNIPTDGKRQADAIKRYRNPVIIPKDSSDGLIQNITNQ